MESRALLLAAPHERSAALHAHLAHCADCRCLAEHAMQLGRQIEDAVRIPAPEGLAARVLLVTR